MSTSSLRGLTQAMGPAGPNPDPLSIGLLQRAQATNQANAQSQYASDYGTDGGQASELAQSVHMMGPLHDPQWDGFLQALHDAGGGKPVNVAGSAGPNLGYDTNDGTAGSETYGSRGVKRKVGV